MKQLLIVPFLFFSIAVIAQDKNKYADLVKAETLKKHLTIIASDEMQGRETGTEGQRKAAAYIEQQFKQLGLSHPASLSGYQQEYPLFKDSLLKGELEI